MRYISHACSESSTKVKPSEAAHNWLQCGVPEAARRPKTRLGIAPKQDRKVRWSHCSILACSASASEAGPYAWDLTLQPPPTPQESAASLLSHSGLLGPMWIRWCLLQHSKYVLYLCCFHLMLINFGSYKNPTCLIWYSDSYFPKKTTASPHVWMSYMWYQWLMQHHDISFLMAKIISRI